MRIIEKIYFILCFSAMLITPAYAYIDPSVATYAVQVVAGVLVAVGAVAGVYIRKFKRMFQTKLGIDENANKEVEDDIVVYY